MDDVRAQLGFAIRASDISKALVGRNSRRLNSLVTFHLENGIPLYALMEASRFARALFQSLDDRTTFLTDVGILSACKDKLIPWGQWRQLNICLCLNLLKSVGN